MATICYGFAGFLTRSWIGHLGLELLARRIPEDDEKGKETIARMKRGIDRAKKIVRGLVDYSSNRKLEFRAVKPDTLVGDALEGVATDQERRQIIQRHRPQMVALGLLCSVLMFVPLLGLWMPAVLGAATAHLGMRATLRLRGHA